LLDLSFAPHIHRRPTLGNDRQARSTSSQLHANPYSPITP
jgi:hypothetical protein